MLRNRDVMATKPTETWLAVDAYFGERLLGHDPQLDAALKANRDAGLPDIGVAPNQGALLNILARSVGAQRILEIGTLGGYSTIWMARALPADGKLVTLEVDPEHAEVAQANVANAGLAGRIDIRVGRAIDLLPRIAAEKGAPFDFVFIDADKANNTAYFEWALKLARPGSLIVVDNVVRGGAVADAKRSDADVEGVRRLAEYLAAEKRVRATAIQTVGVKGYDGLIVAVVL
jgi:predicted O-methyltransferase YrrM